MSPAGQANEDAGDDVEESSEGESICTVKHGLPHFGTIFGSVTTPLALRYAGQRIDRQR
jgi:hypothetical protein